MSAPHQTAAAVGAAPASVQGLSDLRARLTVLRLLAARAVDSMSADPARARELLRQHACAVDDAMQALADWAATPGADLDQDSAGPHLATQGQAATTAATAGAGEAAQAFAARVGAAAEAIAGDAAAVLEQLRTLIAQGMDDNLGLPGMAATVGRIALVADVVCAASGRDCAWHRDPLEWVLIDDATRDAVVQLKNGGAA